MGGGTVVAKEQKRTTSVEAVQDAANARKEGDKEQDAAGGGGQGVAVRGKICCGGGSRPAFFNGMPQRGTRSNGESKPTAAGDVALVLGEVVE